MKELDLSFIDNSPREALESLSEAKGNNSLSEETKALQEAREPIIEEPRSNNLLKVSPRPPKVLTKEELEKKENQQAKRKYKALIKKQEEIISRSSDYRIQINRGLSEGLPAEELLLIACKCISELTGDKLFYNQIKEKLKE